MSKNQQRKTVAVPAAAIGFFLCVGLIGFLCPKTVSGTSGPALETAAPTPRPRVSRTRKPSRYSQFAHDVKAHRLACSSCHKFPSENWQKVRAADKAFPDVTDYPHHESCLNCHRQQFFKGTPPAICSICHTAPSPRNSARHAFPNPREIFDTTAKGRSAVSDFAVSFPHDKHIEIVSKAKSEASFQNASWRRSAAGRRAEESCSVCHQTYKPQGDSDDEYASKPPADLGEGFWLKKGTFKTMPIGHTTCFTCHSADTGLSPAPTDCRVLPQAEAAAAKVRFRRPISCEDGR